MPTRDELYSALRNADKAGDTEGARKLAAYIQTMPAESDASAPSGPLKLNRGTPTGGDSTTKRSAAGAALGVSDIGNTVLNVLTAPLAKISPAVAQWNRTRNADFEYLTEQNKDSTGFNLGRIGGQIAATAPVGGAIAGAARAALPAAAALRAAPILDSIASAGMRTGLPAATTLAGKAASLGVRAIGGAVTGGSSAALINPDDAGRGAVIGAALPPTLIGAGKVASYGGRALKSLVEPFTESGRAAIVGRTLTRFADDPEAIAAASGGQSVTGALPTVAEAAADGGMARLQDALRSVDPQIENMIGGRLAANNAARVSTLQGIAKTPADREAAATAVEAQAKRLYGAAFEENVPVTPALQRLAGKPSVQKAEARAIELARELGTPFKARLDDMRPKSVYAGTRNLPDSSVVNMAPEYNPLTMTTHQVERTAAVPGGMVPHYVEIPPVESVPVRDMHTLKMGMDALLSDPTLGIAGREAAAVTATRNKLLDMLPESYQVARQGHIAMNKPVNQMDIGKRLLQAYSSATEDLSGNPQLRAEAFNRALQDEGKLIKQATGVKGIKQLSDVMAPDQLAAIQGVADELSRTAAVAKAGNGPGAATAQRLASQNILQQLLGRTLGDSTFANTAIGKPLNMLYGGVADPKIQKMLADAVLDPDTAAALVRQQSSGGRSALERLLLESTATRSAVRAIPVATSNR